jgi:hypothetical protein
MGPTRGERTKEIEPDDGVASRISGRNYSVRTGKLDQHEWNG